MPTNGRAAARPRRAWRTRSKLTSTSSRSPREAARARAGSPGLRGGARIARNARPRRGVGAGPVLHPGRDRRQLLGLLAHQHRPVLAWRILVGRLLAAD